VARELHSGQGHPLNVVVHATDAVAAVSDLEAHEAIFSPSGAPGVLDGPDSTFLSCASRNSLSAALSIFQGQATIASSPSLSFIWFTALLGDCFSLDLLAWSEGNKHDGVVKSSRAASGSGDDTTLVVSPDIVTSGESHGEGTLGELGVNVARAVGKSSPGGGARVVVSLDTSVLIAALAVSCSVGVVTIPLGTCS